MIDMYYERCYIGIPLPIEFSESYLKTQKYLDDNIPYLALEKSNQAHITIYYLGNLIQDHIDRINFLIKPLIKEYLPQEIEFGKLKCFEENDPKTLYFEVIDCARLLKLNKELSNLLKSFNFQERIYKPHLTVARLKNPASIDYFLKYRKSILKNIEYPEFVTKCKINEIQIRGKEPASQEMEIFYKLN